MLFRLVLNDDELTGALGFDKNVYFRGQDIASLAGYSGPRYFVKRFCKHILFNIALNRQQIPDDELFTKFIKYDDVVLKKKATVTRDWECFISILPRKVNVEIINNIPKVQVTDEGYLTFEHWVIYQYVQPLLPITPASPSSDSLASTILNSEFSATSPAPQSESSEGYTPASPPYIPPDNSSLLSSGYTPASPPYIPRPMSPSSSGSSPLMSMSPMIRSPNPSSGFLIYMDTMPPNMIKLYHEGQMQLYKKV